MDWGKNHPRKSTYKLLALRFNKVAEYNTAKKVNYIFTYWQQTIRIHNFKTVFTIAKWWRLGGAVNSEQGTEGLKENRVKSQVCGNSMW